MKHQVIVKNGCGWNNYQALSKLKSLPRGIKGLMRVNKVDSLELMPYDECRPLGIAAFFRFEDDLIFTLRFDQNTSADYICRSVMALLKEGIATVINRRRNEINAERLAKAHAAGFNSVAEHEAKLEADRAAKAAADLAARSARNNDPERSARFAASIRKASQLPIPEGFTLVLTRKNKLVFRPLNDATGSADIATGIEVDRDDLYAWQHQHGIAPSIDARHEVLRRLTFL